MVDGCVWMDGVWMDGCGWMGVDEWVWMDGGGWMGGCKIGFKDYLQQSKKDSVTITVDKNITRMWHFKRLLI